jgi:hypothetical protein
METVGGRYEKMEGHCSTGQSPQWAVVPMEEEGQNYSEFSKMTFPAYLKVTCTAVTCGTVLKALK